MCEISEERKYYIRTSLMYTDLTREVLFQVFKYLIKSDDITGFISSLEQQNKLRELLQRHILNQPDYNIVSSQVLNLERFDISLLVRLIINLCKDNIPKPQRGWETKPNPKDESLGADLLRLREVRNKIIGHRADAKLSEAEYENTWAKIKAILLRVVKLVDSQSSENFEQRINGYKQLNVDTENAVVKRILDELLHYKTEYDHLQEKVEALKRRSKEFQEYFKTTPEIFVRYIKLLFDGGRVVLCGIMMSKLGDQDLSDFLERKKETLIRNIDENYSRCLYSQESCSDYINWDVYLLASVLLLTFDNNLSQKEIMYIERIKSARVNYAALALQSLDTVDFVTNWIDLINCLNHLSINIAEDDKLKVEYLIEHYKKRGEGKSDADEYFKQLSESGVDVKTLNDVYKETIKELGDMLNQLSQKDIKFENGFVLELKLLTLCENEEIKKEAEDLLEINLQASIQKSDQPSGSIRSETDKVVAIIAAHPDVTLVEVKRKCIIWSFKCSTRGLLHILDITHGDQLRSTFRNIANELHYIYGYPFLIQGKLTLESVSGVSRMLKKSTTDEAPSEHISIPLKCSSVDGINSVLSTIKMEKTTKSLNRIAEQMSAEFKEIVSIKLIPEMMEFQNVLEEKAMASGSYTLPYGFKPPSESYVFDNLINDLSQAISEQELENLKKSFERVQHVRTPREMFDSLRDMGFIGNYDILYIQQIVRVLDREDLVERLLKYVQMFEEDTVLHFVQEKKITTDGFILVQFHIKGKGISETCQLEEFRREVSRLLLCPIHDVFISGIQETNSTILTLMIPTLYADFLAKQLEKQSQRIISSFMLLSVDSVISNNNEYELQVKGELYKARSTKHQPGQSTRYESRTPKRGMDEEPTKNAHTRKKIKNIHQTKGKRAQGGILQLPSPSLKMLENRLNKNIQQTKGKKAQGGIRQLPSPSLKMLETRLNKNIQQTKGKRAQGGIRQLPSPSLKMLENRLNKNIQQTKEKRAQGGIRQLPSPSLKMLETRLNKIKQQ